MLLGHGSNDLGVFSYLHFLYIKKERGALCRSLLAEAPLKAQVVLNETTEPHAYMYYTPIVRHGFRQGAVRVCIYTTRRAHRNLMSDYLF